MSSKVDWANLLQQERCKALGVPWSPEELKAKEAGVPASYIRAGVLTAKAYKAILAKEEVEGPKLETMDIGQLAEKAAELGIKHTGITPRETLIDLIKKATLLKDAGVDEDEDEDFTGGGEGEEDEETEEEDEEDEEEETEEEEEEKPKKKVKAKTKKKAKAKKKRNRGKK